MCGYCCGGVPVEKRGSGHAHCSTECYNALTPRQVRDCVKRAEDAERALAEHLATCPTSPALPEEPS